MSLGAANGFSVRAVTPRRSVCGRAMPKSPSFSLRPSQTKTFSGRQVAVEHLPAVQLAEHFQDAGNLPARRGFGESLRRVVRCVLRSP